MWNTILLLLPFIMDFAHAKYCAYEDGGETRFYTCPHTEYCCNFGCCLSPTFQFYQLWYYWLLVIFMFLLCSGGGWWYRCWLRGRFPETQTSLSVIPTGTQAHRRNTTIRSTRSAAPLQALSEANTTGPQNQFQVARVSYSTSGDRLVLHRVWKDNTQLMLGSPPSYSTARADSPTLTLPPGTACEAMLMNPYVLYGPPPSYDSVMQQDQAGPSGTQADTTLLPGSSTPSPVDEQESSTETCPSSEPVSPMTPPTPSPCSPQEQSFATSPMSPTADITSDEDRAPETSHQASQTVSSPIVSPTNPNPL